MEEMVSLHEHVDMEVASHLICLGIFSGPKLGITVLNIPFLCFFSVRWDFFFWLVVWFDSFGVFWGFFFVYVCAFFCGFFIGFGFFGFLRFFGSNLAA